MAAAPGALLGVVVLRALPEVALQLAVTVGRRGHAAGAAGDARAHVPAVVAGFAAGALTTTTSTNGPPMLLHLLGRGARPEQVRDTLTVCFIGLAALGALALFVTGTPALPDGALVARAGARRGAGARRSAAADSPTLRPARTMSGC